MALENQKRQVQFTPVEKQRTIAELGAAYGTLAFYYAKAIYNGQRSMDSVQPLLKDSVEAVDRVIQDNQWTLLYS